MSEQRLRQTGEQEEHQESAMSTEQKSETRDFASVEDLMLYDAQTTPPPHRLGVRLGQSIAKEPKAAKPWWKRLL